MMRIAWKMKPAEKSWTSIDFISLYVNFSRRMAVMK